MTSRSWAERRWRGALGVQHAGLDGSRLLPVDLPMRSQLVGLGTPTCGLGRGSTALVRGDSSLAWSYNPVSFAVLGLGVAGIDRERRWSSHQVVG